MKAFLQTALVCFLAAGLAACASWFLAPYQRDALDATRDQDRDGLEAALVAGADPDFVDPSGRTLLHHATAHGAEELVELLLERDADPSPRGEVDRTPLYYAAENGETAIVRRLLEAGADPDAGDGRGRTPLMAAAVRGHREIAGLLLQAGADPDLLDQRGYTALALAAAGRHTELTREFRGQSSRSASAEAVADVVRVGDVATLVWMLDHGLDAEQRWQDDDGRERALLDVASRYSPRSAAVLLAREGVTGEAYGRALVVAALQGDAGRVAELIESGADVDAVLDAGDARGRTALMEGARLGHVTVIEELLEAGADPGRRDEHGADALWHAAVGYTTRRDEAAGLERGADPEETVRLLLQAGVVPEGGGDAHGFAPIHAMAAWGDAETLTALLDAGASVTRADRNGKTPAAYAAQYNNAETLEVLLGVGADPEAVDRIGATPIVHARLAERLVEAGYTLGQSEDPAAARALLEDAGAVLPRGTAGEGTPPLSVQVEERRIMELDDPLALHDTVGYDTPSRLLPYGTGCVGHGCLVPPLVVLPPGTVVELVHREVAEGGRLHSTFLVQEPGMDGLLFEDWVHGAWPPAGHGGTQLTIGRVAHVRSMPWVEAYDVNLRSASGGVIW